MWAYSGRDRAPRRVAIGVRGDRGPGQARHCAGRFARGGRRERTASYPVRCMSRTQRCRTHLAPGGFNQLAKSTGKQILFYCAFGERSAMAVQAAHDAGPGFGAPHPGRNRRLEEGFGSADALNGSTCRASCSNAGQFPSPREEAGRGEDAGLAFWLSLELNSCYHISSENG